MKKIVFLFARQYFLFRTEIFHWLILQPLINNEETEREEETEEQTNENQENEAPSQNQKNAWNESLSIQFFPLIFQRLVFIFKCYTFWQRNTFINRKPTRNWPIYFLLMQV